MRESSPMMTSQLVTSSGDISLVIDENDVICDVGFGSDKQVIEEALHWVGKPWVEVVTSECRGKIRDLLETTEESAPSAWRQVNHPTDSGADIPVMYRALARDADGHLVVVGRDLRQMSELQQQLLDVQHSMEQDYARLHQAESRYRMLFTLASEAILIVDSGSRRIVDANPAAGKLLGRPSAKLVGRTFPRGFTEASEDAIGELLAQVRASGSSEDIKVRLESADDEYLLGATLMRRDEGLYFLVRISPHATGRPAETNQALVDVISRAPDAFVITDPEGRILSVNSAFVELCQLGSEQQAAKQPLDRWVGRAGVDIDVLRKNLHKRSYVKQFATTINPEFGEAVDVDLSAVAALDASIPCLGFVLRPTNRPQVSKAPLPDQPLAESLQNMTELIGRVPLKELVRETSDIIERLCIEAALKMTNDNRASAAELLGLSRQSLYVKLRRYELADYPAEKES